MSQHNETPSEQEYLLSEIERKTDIIIEMSSLAKEIYSLRGEDEVTARLCEMIIATSEK